MKKINFLFVVLTVISILFYFTSCSNSQSKTNEDSTDTASTTPAKNEENLVQMGEYLVTIMGCNDCHSPKRMGSMGPEIIPELMLSGYPSDRPIEKFEDPKIKQGFAMFYPDLTAAAGPWGISFSGNLTPDETGIGNWTEEQFKIALTQGKFKGLENGRMLLPSMPWLNYKNMKDEDIKAIFLYLKSIKPVKNIVPSPITPDKM
jgi:hypothetical protein